MKQVLCLLVLALLLCGCQEPAPETTAPPPETQMPTQAPTEPAGFYVPGSDLELLTEGAIHVYQPEIPDSYALASLENDLLVFSGTENTTLTLLRGDSRFPAATAQLSCRISPEDPAFRISHGSISYFDSAAPALVFLDRDLKEVRRIELPDSLTGSPALSEDRLQLYYCTPDSIRALDLETGLDRLLKSIAYPAQQTEDVILGGTVIRCGMTDDDGARISMFLSAETGQLITETSLDPVLHCAGDTYYARIQDGLMPVHLAGEAQQEARMLIPRNPFADSRYLSATHSLLTLEENPSGTTWECYDLHTGLRTAALTLSQGITVTGVTQEAGTGHIWLLVREEGIETNQILRWDPRNSPSGDDNLYLSHRCTLENPDAEGLALCAEIAAELGNTYGLEILIGPEASAREPQDYYLEAEYQVPVIRRQLDALASVLAAFPEDFFTQIPGTEQILLVRSITGKPESGSIAAAAGLQYWLGDAACVALAAGDTLPGAFYHEMFHIIDSRILSDSNVYYYWHNLNPDGCRYFEDYTSYLTADVEKYLQEETRAFIDAYSMCYPREDRARIMEYACQEGNAHYFQSEIMQNKLKLLCQGIRKVFGLTDHPESFLWEQYLAQPLTK